MTPPNCDNHAERKAEYTLFSATNPRAIVKNFCLECRNAYYASTSTSPREMARSGEQPWGGMEMTPWGTVYQTDHTYLNPNAIYARAVANNKDITE